jgi:hypothetical protein
MPVNERQCLDSRVKSYTHSVRVRLISASTHDCLMEDAAPFEDVPMSATVNPHERTALAKGGNCESGKWDGTPIQRLLLPRAIEMGLSFVRTFIDFRLSGPQLFTG